MILPETSIQEFPRRRRQIIIKKYPRELHGPLAAVLKILLYTTSFKRFLFLFLHFCKAWIPHKILNIFPEKTWIKRNLNLFYDMVVLLKKITSFPSKQCIFFFRERSEQHFAQLFKFDSSSSFRNISINKKKKISYYITYIVVLGRK